MVPQGCILVIFFAFSLSFTCSGGLFFVRRGIIHLLGSPSGPTRELSLMCTCSAAYAPARGCHCRKHTNFLFLLSGVCLVSRFWLLKPEDGISLSSGDALLDYSGYSYVCYGAITSGVDLRWHCCPTTTMFAEQIVPSCTATDAQQQLCLLSRLRLVAATTMFAEQAWPFGA